MYRILPKLENVSTIDLRDQLENDGSLIPRLLDEVESKLTFHLDEDSNFLACSPYSISFYLSVKFGAKGIFAQYLLCIDFHQFTSHVICFTKRSICENVI